MNVSCTRSSTSASRAPPPARNRASARPWRRTSSVAARSSPACQAAISAASLDGTDDCPRGKEELLYLIQERCFTRVLEGARGALADRDDAPERLQAFIRHHVTFFAHHMAEMKVLSHEANVLTGDLKRRVNAIKRRYVDLLEGLLKDAAPEERPVDRSAAAYALFGMMDWIYNWYDPAGEVDPQSRADLIARIFVGGFAEARSTVEGG